MEPKQASESKDRSPARVAPVARVSPQEFVEQMRGQTEHMLKEVMEAVNRAPDGTWINASEMQVRDLLGEYRRHVYQKALQMKTEAAEGAFSPGGPGGPGRWPAEGQGP